MSKDHPINALLVRVKILYEDWAAHRDDMSRETLHQLVERLKANHEELVAWMKRKELP